MKIIDFRGRALTPQWLQFLEMPFQARHAGRAKALQPGGKFTTQTVADFVKEMDDNSTEIAVWEGRDIETTLGYRESNEELAKTVSEFPDRLIGYAGIDPNKGMAAVREVDKAVKLGLKGVSLDPFLQKLRANDKKVYPIYAKCAEYGLPVSITTGLSAWGADWGYMDLCNPLDIDEVATDFSEVTFIMAHTGFPWVFEAIAVARRHPNVFLETSGLSTAYVACGGEEPYIKAANAGLSDQFVFGSAAPYYRLKLAIDSFKVLGFKPEVLNKIFYDNAARILKLDTTKPSSARKKKT